MNTFLLRAYATWWDFTNAHLGTDLPSMFPNTYGTFVAMGFLAAAVFTYLELKRREEAGLIKGYQKQTTIGTGPVWSGIIVQFFVGFVLGWKIIGIYTVGVDQVANQQGGLGYVFSGQGSIIGGLLIGALMAGYLFWTQHKSKLPKPIKKTITVHTYDQIGDMVFIAAIFGIVGSNVFEMFQPGFSVENILSDPTSLFSGLTIYGGLFFGIIGIWIFSLWRKIKLFHLFDSIAPGYLLAYGIGRLGCHFSGDGDWGIINTSTSPRWIPDYFWANDYAHSVIGGQSINGNSWIPISGCEGDYCYALSQTVWPTSIYEFIFCVVLFAIMWSVRKKVTHAPGFMMCLLFVFNAIERYPIEIIRVTDRYTQFGIDFTQAQLISIGLFLIGITGMFYIWKKSSKADVA